MSLVGLAATEGVELAEDLGVASQQASDEHHQKKDDDAFYHDERFHAQVTRPHTTGIAPAAPKENV